MNSVKVNYLAVGVTLTVVFILMFRMYHVNRIESRVNLKEVLSASIDLAERGGMMTIEVKAEHKLHTVSKGLTVEGKKEMKTDGDMKSHRAIISGFHRAFPQLSTRIVSEEHDEKHENDETFMPKKSHSSVAKLADEWVSPNDITIWVDPLDATQEYTEDLDQYVTVMICVAVKGLPIIGVIHRPHKTSIYKNETVWAWVEKAVSPNLEKSLETALPQQPKVIISRSHAGNVKDEVDKAFGKGEVISAGGAGYKTIEVVRGKAHVYAHITRIKKWDICAGNALLNAVGGKMKTLNDGVIDYRKETDAVNNDGLLAALYNFDHYMTKLGPIFQQQQAKSAH